MIEVPRIINIVLMLLVIYYSGALAHKALQSAIKHKQTILPYLIIFCLFVGLLLANILELYVYIAAILHLATKSTLHGIMSWRLFLSNLVLTGVLRMLNSKTPLK